MKRFFAVLLALVSLLPFAATAATGPCVTITRYLTIGSRGTDVTALQNYLISQNYLSVGLSTGYFGARTQGALQAFQKSSGVVSNGSPLTTGYGAVGPKTRAALALCTPAVVPPVVTPPVIPQTPPTTTPVVPPTAPPVSVDVSPVVYPSTSPQYASVAADTPSVTLSAFKFRPDLEAVNMDQIGLTLASGSTGDLTKVSLWATVKNINGMLYADPAGTLTQIGSTIPTGSSMVVVLSPRVQFPKNIDTTVWVAGDIAPIGTSYPGHSGNLIQINLDSASTRGTGKDSGRAQAISGAPDTPGKRIFKSVPTLTYATDAGIANNGSNDLLSLTVTADKKGDVTLGKLTFAIYLTGASANAFTLSGPNGIVHAAATRTLSGSELTIPFDSSSNVRDATIAAGTSKTFTLRVQDLSFSGSSGSISAALMADTSFSGMSTQAALSGSNVVWSPDSTESPASVSGSDWANGYGLPGCFTNAGLGSNCSSRTLSR